MCWLASASCRLLSWISFEQPHVLDGYCRLVGEGGNELDLFVAERPHRVAHQSENADRRALAQHRHCNDGAEVAKCRTSERVFRIGAHIRDVNHRALQQCAPGRGPAGERNRMLLHESHEFAGVLVAGGKPQQIAVGPHNGAHIRLAKPGRRLDQRVKYRLQVEGRAADHLEHVGSGSLLLQRFAQIVGAPAQLIQQPRVLDGDDRLVGERRHQVDLFRGKWLRPVSPYKDHSDDLSLTQERDAQRSPITGNLLGITPRIFRVRQHIEDVNHSSLQRGASGHAASIDRGSLELLIIPQARVDLGSKTEAGDPAENFTIAFEQPGLVGVAQPCHQFDQGIEHSLQIEGGAADHLEHVGGGGLLLQGLRAAR